MRLPSACGLCCDSIQAATCLLTNEVGLAPVSNRVVTESELGLLPVVMQHVRYMVSTRLPVEYWYVFHDFGLWFRQQREGLSIVHEELDMIEESMDTRPSQ